MPIYGFMKNFLLHIVPYRFVRIRYYGLLSNSTKKKQVDKCREYYKVKAKKENVKTWQEIYHDITGHDIYHCLKCHKGKMLIIEVIARAGP